MLPIDPFEFLNRCFVLINADVPKTIINTAVAPTVTDNEEGG